MAAVTRVQRFRVRACFNGNLYWTCAWCGNKNVTRMNNNMWSVGCTGDSCGGNFIPAVLFYPNPPGRPRKPSDYVAPEGNQLIDSFPEGELVTDVWRHGDRVHRLYGAEALRELNAVEAFFDRAMRGARISGTALDALNNELSRMRHALGLTPASSPTTITPVAAKATKRKKEK